MIVESDSCSVAAAGWVEAVQHGLAGGTMAGDTGMVQPEVQPTVLGGLVVQGRVSRARPMFFLLGLGSHVPAQRESCAHRHCG